VLTALALLTTFAPHAAWAKPRSAPARPDPNEPQKLPLGGGAPDAYFVPARVRGLRPVFVFLHGRGGRPVEDCRKWANIVTPHGWLVCPQGPEDRGGGTRGWNNNAVVGQRIAEAAVQALRAKYGGRVQLRSNVLIGFSEGAFVAMQVGLNDPVRWNRWLILAANDQYWFGADTAEKLRAAKRHLRRVYLLTGEADEVAPNTKRVADMLKAAKIPVRVQIEPGMGHEIPADKMSATYRRPIGWLEAAR
jgi:predicted esterase